MSHSWSKGTGDLPVTPQRSTTAPLSRVYVSPSARVEGGVSVGVTTNSAALCPDLLDIDDIGVADNARGRVVRAFFRLLAWVWPVR